MFDAAARRKRPYDLGLRGAQADARKHRVMEAATELFFESGFEKTTLQAIADAAEVGLKTVLRQFGSKEALLLAIARVGAPGEQRLRGVERGDVRGAAKALADRYESHMDAIARFVFLEQRFRGVAKVLMIGRRAHLDWLGRVFSPWLRRDRERRLAQLFGATELIVYRSWRRHLRLDRKTAESVLAGTLEALVAHWEGESQ